MIREPENSQSARPTGRKISQEAIIASIIPEVSFQGEKSKDIKRCSEMDDPEWDDILTDDEFPEFDDGYDDKFFHNDLDRDALNNESELCRESELYDREDRRNRLWTTYNSRRSQWEEKRARKANKYEVKSKLTTLSHKHGGYESDEDIFSDDYEDYNNIGVIKSSQQQREVKRPKSFIDFKEFKQVQLTRKILSSWENRPIFEKAVIGFYGKLQTDEVVVITEPADCDPYTSELGTFTHRLIVQLPGSLERRDVAIEDFSDSLFNDEDYKAVRSTSSLPSKNQIRKLVKTYEDVQKSIDHHGEFIEKRIRLVLSGNTTGGLLLVHELHQLVNNLEEELAKNPQDEDIQKAIKIKQQQIDAIQKIVAPERNKPVQSKVLDQKKLQTEAEMRKQAELNSRLRQLASISSKAPSEPQEKKNVSQEELDQALMSALNVESEDSDSDSDEALLDLI